MYTVSPRRIPCRICGNYTAEQMVYGTFRTGPRPGFLHDPQDLTTMHQDAQGTLPVYRPGTGLVDPPVGLMLDKSQGVELGPELWDGALVVSNGTSGASGAYNAVTGELSNTVVGTQTYAPGFVGPLNRLELNKFYRVKLKFSGNLDPLFSVTLHTSSSTPNFPVGGVGGDAIRSAGGEIEYIGTNQNNIPGLRINTDGRTIWSGLFIESISIREIKGYHAYQNTTTARPTLSGRYNLLTATEILSTQSVTTEAGIHTIRLSDTGTITLSGAATGTYSAGTHTITCTAGTLACTVDGTVTKADLRKTTAQNLPAYQSVTDADNYDTEGFLLYLKRDLIDDELIVQSPGFSGQRIAADFDAVTSDAVTIAAGEYKPFGAVDAGPAECTQLLVVAAPSADETTVFERYAAEKGLLHGGV